MSKHKFTASKGYLFQDDDGVWAQFELESESRSLTDGVSAKVYAFETDDDKVAARLNKIDAEGYDIAEEKSEPAKKAPAKKAAASTKSADDPKAPTGDPKPEE